MDEQQTYAELLEENQHLREELSFYQNYGADDEVITKESIMKIENSVKRQKAIQENIHLFKD